MKNTYQQVAELIAFIIEHKLETLSLEDIAEQAGKSPAYVQKLFTEWVGVSPKQFGRYLSVSYAKELLAKGATNEKAATAAGLSGTGRLHDLFVVIEAMSPGVYKNGGVGLHIEYGIYNTQFGFCLVATTPVGVCNILFGATSKELIHDLQDRWPAATIMQKKNKTQAFVVEYLRGVTQPQKIKLHIHGTNLQLKVWEALLHIREGDITSYGTIAKKINQPNQSRAVGAAVGSNPIGYIIPCHRVLKASGEISGYRWGVERKRVMLEYEALKTRHK